MRTDMKVMMPLMDIAGDVEGSIGTDCKAKVPVYDSMGRIISVDELKRKDLIVVFWREKRMNCLVQSIQGREYFLSLMEFDRVKYDLGGESGTLYGREFSKELQAPDYYRFYEIEKIHYAGHDLTGKTMSFIRELYTQKVKAERLAEKMRINIDALKA